MLSRRHGKVRAVGKGVRRTSSRFGARLEPGSHIDVQFHTGRTLDIVTQTESLGAYGAALAGDYPRWTAASAICETTDRLTDEGEPALHLYLLLVGALRALVAHEHAGGLVLDAFLIRAMSNAGWEPALGECAKCSAPGPHTAFNVAAGGAVCDTCHTPGSTSPDRDTIALMVALLRGDWARADASTLSQRREASGLIAAHLQWHLERGLRSLPLVDRA
jgi:DNA repair protein RecO (recombination protein O)